MFHYKNGNILTSSGVYNNTSQHTRFIHSEWIFSLAGTHSVQSWVGQLTSPSKAEGVKTVGAVVPPYSNQPSTSSLWCYIVLEAQINTFVYTHDV